MNLPAFCKACKTTYKKGIYGQSTNECHALTLRNTRPEHAGVRKELSRSARCPGGGLSHRAEQFGVLLTIYCGRLSVFQPLLQSDSNVDAVIGLVLMDPGPC